MSASFYKVVQELDIGPLRQALLAKPHLFGEKTLRAEAPDSPHAQMTDIWVRYNDDHPYNEAGDFSAFSDEHESVWYQVVLEIPQVLPIVFSLMRLLNGERLGGVLITKLPPGGRIEKHIDQGWHAGHYSKFFVPIQNKAGAAFRFEDGDVEAKEGEAWYFDNSVPHWVENNSDEDRIAMIVCIKTHMQSMNERLSIWENRLDVGDQQPQTIADLVANAIATGDHGVELEVQHHFSNGLYSKEIHIPKGKFVLSHQHTYSHLSFLGKGSVVVKTDNDDGVVYKAPACLNIPAGLNHGIFALQDAVWYCTHATSETDIGKIDETLIQKEGV